MDEGSWIRCRKVEIWGDDIVSELALDKPYDLAGSYPKDPHVQFLNCKTDNDIVRFVRAWGPHFLQNVGGADDELQKGVVVRPIARYRADLRRFKGVKDILEAAKGNCDERAALYEFVAADEETSQFNPIHKSGDPPFLQFSIRLWQRVEGDIYDWIRTGPISQVRIALKFCVESEVSSSWSGGVRVVPYKGRTKVVPCYRLSTLETALSWMVWFDEWNASTPKACPACHTVFRPPSQHKMKYCSTKCAHRIAVQMYRERKKRSGRPVATKRAK